MSSRFVSAGGAEVKAPEGLTERDESDAWAKARKQVEEYKKPEKPPTGTQEGGLSLYEHLQAQKAAKQEAFEEATKLRNQFRPLDDSEVDFLESVKRRERDKVSSVQKETAEQLEAFRKERLAAEELAREAASVEDDTTNTKDAKEAWTTAKKRRRAKFDEKANVAKAKKMSKTTDDDQDPTGAPGKTAQAESMVQSQADAASKPTAVEETRDKLPEDVKTKQVSGLVAYDSDSDG